MLNSALRRLREYSSSHVIVAGDFNSSLSHDSELRNLLIADGLCRVPVKGLTFAVPGYTDTLDHIWATKSLHPNTLLGSTPEVLSRIAAQGLPDCSRPSDHLPVAAKFDVLDPDPQRPRPGSVTSEQPSFNPLHSCHDFAIYCEWLQILDCARQAIQDGQPKKKAIHEQSQIEKAFFEAIGDETAACLRQWYAGIVEAAKCAVTAAVLGAQARIHEKQTLQALQEKQQKDVMKFQSKSNGDQTRFWDPGGFSWQSLDFGFLNV